MSGLAIAWTSLDVADIELIVQGPPSTGEGLSIKPLITKPGRIRAARYIRVLTKVLKGLKKY